MGLIKDLTCWISVGRKALTLLKGQVTVPFEPWLLSPSSEAGQITK